MPIDTVFLDAGGVLVHPNWAIVSRVLARHGIRVDPAALADAELRAARQLDAPEHFRSSTDQSRWYDFLGLVLAQAGVRPSADLLRPALDKLREHHDRENLWDSVPPDVPGALDRLRAAGYRLVVVSNSNGTVREKLTRVGVARRVDLVIDSREEGVEKPDPRLFRIALERSGAKAETTLHVGDLYHVDVVGARAAGIKVVLLDRAGLSADRDCPRVASLGALVDALKTGGL